MPHSKQTPFVWRIFKSNEHFEFQDTQNHTLTKKTQVMKNIKALALFGDLAKASFSFSSLLLLFFAADEQLRSRKGTAYVIFFFFIKYCNFVFALPLKLQLIMVNRIPQTLLANIGHTNTKHNQSPKKLYANPLLFEAIISYFKSQNLFCPL